MKKALLIVCAVVCSVFFVSAQQSSEQVSKIKQSLKSIDWTPKYKGEVNVGYAISGKNFDWTSSYSDSDGESDSEAVGKMQTVFSRPLIETVHGVEIGPYLFVGAGVGLQYYCGKLNDFQELADLAAEVKEKDKSPERWNAVMLPIFADIKFQYPVNNNFTPFLNLGLGGTVGCYSSVNCKYAEEGIEISTRARGGFYCDFGAGFRYKMLNVSLGLQHQGFALAMKESESYDGEPYSADMKLSTKINSFYVKVGVNF
jgi:hypothetical protein